MTAARITVSVGTDGKVLAERWEGPSSPIGKVAYGGLDAELVEHFERWLTLRDRVWREDEIRSFGALLHRCLFPDEVWNFVQTELGDRVGEPVRLALRFPTAGAYARLASLPWEYLYRPEETGHPGFFLADAKDLVLSRYVPPAPNAEALRPRGEFGILVVVSAPRDPLLGPVESEEVLAALDLPPGQVLTNPTLDQLETALREAEPHVLHFMGHGRFLVDRREGSLAFSTAGGGTDWVSEGRLVTTLHHAGRVPRIVVLHACEGGAATYAERFAGLGPSLIRGGVPAVVAMQYEVTNETAIAFRTPLYRELRQHPDVDRAVQTCRWLISGRQDGDPRLRGIPVVYLDGSAVMFEREWEQG